MVWALHFLSPGCSVHALSRNVGGNATPAAMKALCVCPGFVPRAASKRVLKEYGVCASTPLSVDIVPFPFLRLPCYTADADLFMFLGFRLFQSIQGP
jgi:hypothetical protein